MFTSCTFSSIATDVFIVLLLLGMAFLGFYLGNSIRRQEQRLNNLTRVIDQYGKDINDLKDKYEVIIDGSIKDKIRNFFIKERKF